MWTRQIMALGCEAKYPQNLHNIAAHVGREASYQFGALLIVTDNFKTLVPRGSNPQSRRLLIYSEVSPDRSI